MTFKLSKTSLGRLEGVDERLVECVKLALTKSTADFSIIGYAHGGRAERTVQGWPQVKCDGYEAELPPVW